jgi:hypothetical protein
MHIAKTRPDVSLRGPLAGCFALSALLGIASSMGTFRQALQGELINPDSYMRLVRLHDELAAGHTLHGVARDGSGHGTVLHWSHLLDSLLVLLAAPLTLLTDTDTALRWAGLALGPLSLGALGAALAWAVAPVAGRGFLWAAAVASALAPAILGYGMVGVVHHHVLLAAAAAMAAGWALRLALGQGGSAAGMALGAWVPAGIWLSPETMPFGLMAFGGLALAWLLKPATPGLRPGLAAAGSTLLALVAAALLVDPPAGGRFTLEVDCLSGVYLALGAACCAAGWAMARLGRTGGAALGGLCLLAWMAAFPSLLRGAAAVVPAAQLQALDGISELAPINTLHDLLGYLVTGILTAGLLGWLAWRRQSALLAYAAFCGLVIVVLAAVHVRFSTYAATIAAAMLPVALTLANRALAGAEEHRRALARVGLIALAVLLPRLAVLLPAPASASPPVSGALCNTRAAAALLAPYAGRIVLTHPNDTPELLYRTGVLTVGSLYHRNAEALLRLQAAWKGVAGTVPGPAVEATGATLFLICPREKPPPGADTLAARLSAGDVPPWLRRIAAEPSGYVLYERLLETPS